MIKVNLYSDILTTKGYNRSVFFDSGLNKIHFVDNKLFDDFHFNNFKNINLKNINPYFHELLKENDLIFESKIKLKDSFPLIELKWDYSFKITNVVFHLSNQNVNDFIKIIETASFISHFNLLIDNKISLKTINIIFRSLNNHLCDSLEFTFLEYLDDKIRNRLITLINEAKKMIRFNNYAKINLGDESIKPNRYFLVLEHRNLKLAKNLDHFTESQEHHTYFNRKLFIDKTGNIKNAEECQEIFGNLKDLQSSEDLEKIIDSTIFQKYWYVKKEYTDICKDCEFKNLCIDNRLPIKRKKNEWYHKNECTYNPYISKWFDEDGYKSLSECGIKSNANGFSIDEKKIKKINDILWNEEEGENK